jgi:glycerol-3-phosphate dehydrogenase
MLGKDWRNIVWGNIIGPWDLLIIGGGITGAGLFRMAVKAGLKTLLVEGNDFAYGTSSRSSKLVHGGLRYIKNGQYNVTFESVRERERLLKEAPGLVKLVFHLVFMISLVLKMLTENFLQTSWDLQPRI